MDHNPTEKLTPANLLKNISIFNRNRKFITTQEHLININIILPFMPRSYREVFPGGFPMKPCKIRTASQRAHYTS